MIWRYGPTEAALSKGGKPDELEKAKDASESVQGTKEP
jgi:hypothetical protein